MWNPNLSNPQDDDDSWEVKAFAEDTSNVMGTTWPPRSYTCTFCKREFRSAQALGGHMNVHRRDRARLHQAHQSNLINPSISSTSTLLIPTQELVPNGGLCLLYSLQKPISNFNPSSLNDIKGSPSTLLSISPRINKIDNLMDFLAEATPHSFNPPLSNSSYTEASTSKNWKSKEKDGINKKRKMTDSTVEGIDLELRLGCSSLGF